MRKITALLLALTMLLTMAACSQKKPGPTTPTIPKPTEPKELSPIYKIVSPMVAVFWICAQHPAVRVPYIRCLQGVMVLSWQMTLAVAVRSHLKIMSSVGVWEMLWLPIPSLDISPPLSTFSMLSLSMPPALARVCSAR